MDDNSIRINIKSGYIDVERINIPYDIKVAGVTVDDVNTEIIQEDNGVLFKATANSEIVFKIV